MPVVSQTHAKGVPHRHSWRDRRVVSTFWGITIAELPQKRVLQKCNRCRVEREQIRNDMGAIAWLQDHWYGGAEMFERFTERARRAVAIAQDEALAMKHESIGTEHVLFGLMAEEDGLASKVLCGLGVDLGTLRTCVAGLHAPTTGTDGGQLPFTGEAKKGLELALREALSLGHNYIGTEHVLLGLVREEGNEASRILAHEFSVTGEHIRQEIIRFLTQVRAKPATSSVAPAKAPDHPHLKFVPVLQKLRSTALDECSRTSTDDAFREAWFNLGHAADVLDRMIAQL